MKWIPANPTFAERETSALFGELVHALSELRSGGAPPARAAPAQALAGALRARVRGLDLAAFDAAASVLVDLLMQGWALRADGASVEVAQPEHDANPSDEKRRVRAQLLVERDGQLGEAATLKFVRDMERRRPHRGKFRSIFDLFRDGRELERTLRACQSDGDLTRAISPYVQVVNNADRCDHTGLRLMDIWRYFRHTWSSPYRSVPGRTMMFLIRDAARDAHPVIGIAALGSAAVQITVRDDRLGWSPELVMEAARANPTDADARWVTAVIEKTLAEVFIDDLLADKVVTPDELRTGSQEAVDRLLVEARHRRDLHHRLSDRNAHKSTVTEEESKGDDHWRTRALTDLFRSKRAESLAGALRARRALLEAGGAPNASTLKALLATEEGRRVYKIVARKAKGDRVGTAIADVIVCGALPPYGPLLGGKLVSMMLASPEVGAAYEARYGGACSVIASSIAGRAIVRPAKLVFLGTTSLYSAQASQYNRLRMPAEAAGGLKGERIEYAFMGFTRGFGTGHLSERTTELLRGLMAKSDGGNRVNSIFGEGVSPRLRGARDGLSLLGLPADALLNHGSPRGVYGVPLARNLQRYLLGMDDEPELLLPRAAPRATTDMIVAWWRERWLAGRVRQEHVLASVAAHRLTHPVRHGARVPCPTAADAGPTLFGDGE